jgi:hypothetical protein
MSTFVINNSVIPQRSRKKTEGSSHPFQIVVRQVDVAFYGAAIDANRAGT